MDLAAWIQELRRRRVIRALLGWGLFSFAVLQVVEPVQHALGLAEWALRLVVGILAVGFPVTAGLAWAFDLTRKGIERTAPSESANPTGVPSTRGAGPAVALVVVGALIGGGVAWLALRHFRPPSPVPGADGRVSVAVADFANQTGEPALDALSGLLITSLEQSRKLKVLTRGRMLELLRQDGHDKVDRIDEALARRVGSKAEVRALLLASIQKLGQSYVVELRAVDPQQDHYLFAVREQASDHAGILPLIDRLSEQARQRLREPGAEPQGFRVAEATTPNLEAYRHYFKGKELRARLDDFGAVKEFRKALELEPDFTLAQLEISLVAWIWLLPEEGLYRNAARNASRLPEKEREIVLAWSEMQDGHPAEAAARSSRLAERYPTDTDVLMVAALTAQDPHDKVRFSRRVLALVPDHSEARVWLSLFGVPLGLAKELLQDALAEERARPTAGAATAVGIARLGTGDPVAAADDFRRAMNLASYPWSDVGLTMALSLADDQQGLRKRAREDRSEMAPVVGAIADIRLGRLQEAARTIDAAATTASSGGDFWRFVASVVRTAGDGRPEALLPPWAAPGLREAVVLRKAGDLDGAVRALGPVDDRECGLRAWLLGTIASDQGRHAEAVTLLRRFEPCHLIGMQGLFQLLQLDDALVRIARGLAATGRPDEARQVLKTLLTRWEGADPDMPLLLQAKALCGELRCRG